MKGYIFDIKRFAIHDGPGIRTTVFLTGCPLRCWWCHNPESLRKINDENLAIISSAEVINCHAQSEADIIEFTPENLFTEIKKDIIFFEESNGGVTFSGGEPLTQSEFLNEILGLCKTAGINTVIDTSGYASANSFQTIYDRVDHFLFDVKLIDDKLHKEYTGVSNQLILENLNWLTEQGNKVRIRIPLIPGITDTKKNLSEIIKLLKSLNNIDYVNLLPYNHLAEAKYKKLMKESKTGSLSTQTEDELKEITRMFDSLDVRVNIRG